jgi:hypothetical protein
MPPDFFGKGVALRVRGDSRMRLKNYGEAEKDLAAAYGILAKQSAPGSPRLSELTNLVAEDCDHLGKTEVAAEWRAKATPKKP